MAGDVSPRTSPRASFRPSERRAVTSSEPTIDPDVPIIDSHHHLFDKANDWLFSITDRRRFLVEEYSEAVTDGHNVIASVCVESHGMYRSTGPAELRVVGETEFLNGQAAMGATGLYGGVRVASGIVGAADLNLGEAVRPVLEAHLRASPDRFRGIRYEAMWDGDPDVLGGRFPSGPSLYVDKQFRRGFSQLAPLGLTFDAFVLAPQLADVTDLARSFPETRIILNHLGHPVGIGVHAGRMEEEFPAWRKHMSDIAACENVAVKMGGLGSFLSGSPTFRCTPPAKSEVLAAEWRPYVDTTVELFGADRVMFESNLPTDGSGAFNTVCNAYKHILADCSESERRSIFARTAAAAYRLDVGAVLDPATAGGPF
jgi:L-fuconolactonase